jgi:hypothetical protein
MTVNTALELYPWYAHPPLPLVYWTPYPWCFDPLPMAYQIPYPWHVEPLVWDYESPTHGLSNRLPMVYWTPYLGLINPLPMVVWRPLPTVYRTSYPWYFKPPNHGKTKPVCMVFLPLIHDITNPLSMVYRTPIHCILNPFLRYIETPSMVYWAPYAWYIEPSTHDISNPLSLVHRTPSYGIMNPLPMEYRTPSLGKNEEVQFGVKISYGILNPGSIFQGFKIPYDTCLWWRYCCSIKFSCVMSCKSLFVTLSFFLGPLYCLSFCDLRLLYLQSFVISTYFMIGLDLMFI